MDGGVQETISAEHEVGIFWSTATGDEGDAMVSSLCVPDVTYSRFEHCEFDGQSGTVTRGYQEALCAIEKRAEDGVRDSA